jgi:hypothetical protein
MPISVDMHQISRKRPAALKCAKAHRVLPAVEVTTDDNVKHAKVPYPIVDIDVAVVTNEKKGHRTWGLHGPGFDMPPGRVEGVEDTPVKY